MFLINTAMEKIPIGTAALIVALGMAVVFFGLILLMFVTKIAGAIINRKNTAAPAAAPAAASGRPGRSLRSFPPVSRSLARSAGCCAAARCRCG